jgi:tRNA dimethylallyltransferase
VAEEVAVRLRTEIVSADSMQVYRGMDIGTAKPPPSERRVPYHCIDLVDPGVAYSAALFQRDARTAIDALLGQGLVPVVTGGTGLYVRAALDDWTFPPGEAATPLRERLEKLAPEELYAMLAEIDPEAAALIHQNNTRRVVRALEMAEQGTSYAEQKDRFKRRESIYDTVFVGLTMERGQLYDRIDERVDLMVEAGLIDEVGRLLDAGYRDALTSAQAIGYKELVPVIEGTDTLEHAVDEIKRASRRYAKRQLTWFRGDERVTWLDVTGTSASEAATSVLALVESHAGT